MGIAEKTAMQYIASQYDKCIAALDDIRSALEYIEEPERLEDYERYFRALSGLMQETKAVELRYSLTSVKTQIDSSFEEKISLHLSNQVRINEKYEKLIASRKEDLIREAKEKNSQAVDAFKRKNAVYENLEIKRKQLQEYSDQILDLCTKYGVRPSEVAIDNSTFTAEELDKLYDQYLDYMGKHGPRKDVISLFKAKLPDIRMQSLALVAALIASCTVVLDIIAAAAIIAIISSQIKASEKVKMYTVLLGLIFNVDPLSLGFQPAIDKEDLEDEEINEETDVRFKDIIEEWSAEIESAEQNDPAILLEKERLWFVNNAKALEAKMGECVKQVGYKKEGLLEDLSALISIGKEEYADKARDIRLLGSDISESYIFNTNFRLGLRNGAIEEIIDIGMKNVVIRPNKDEHQMTSFLQVMLANALCNVRPGYLNVIIYDPNKFGQSLVSFYDQELAASMRIVSEGLDAELAVLKGYAMQTMKDMKGLKINEYNEEAVKVGKITKEYYLLIVLSQSKALEETETLIEFMSYSANYGVFIWMVSEADIKDTKVFECPFMGVDHPYGIDQSVFGQEVVKNYLSVKKRMKPTPLEWSTYSQIGIPDSKVWTYSAFEFVQLKPGFQDGDPSKDIYYTVGNSGDIHALAAGGTGAGKSVFLNHLIITACEMYPPDELELWLIDYKCAEFVDYLPSDKKPKVLPHIKACLCTTDGAYADSVYAALLEEMTRRNALFNEIGKQYGVECKNLYVYNKLMKQHNRVEDILPRILLINDEFQVIFQIKDNKILDNIRTILTKLAKLGRSAGVNLLFTSQSLSGTLSKDVLSQFTLRFVLRCAQDVSMDLLGTENASNIRERFGFLYVRDLSGGVKLQRRFKTPYFDEKKGTFRKEIDKLADLAAAKGFKPKDLVTYNEKTVHGVSELHGHYRQYADVYPDGSVILGNRMTYMPGNKAPDNVILNAKNNTHIISAFADEADFVNFYKQLNACISHYRKAPGLIVNSQVEDWHYLCELDRLTEGDEVMEAVSKPSMGINTIYKMLEDIYEARTESKCKDLFLAVLIGWDKAAGWGIDKDTNLISKFSNLLQVCGEYNMHVVFISSTVAGWPPGLIAACKYRICGRCDEKSSFALLDTKQGCTIDESGLTNGYIYVWEGTGLPRRAKLYLSEQTREIEKSTVVIN